MNPSQINNQKILYASLDWGLGHVMRSIAVIQDLLPRNEIIIACNSQQVHFFLAYFPNVKIEKLNGYDLKFKGTGKWSLDLLKQAPKMLKSIKSENKIVEKLSKKHQIDLIISDHRYGFRNSKIESIFVTHQLHLPLKSWQKSIQRWHERQLNKFNEIWVLDEGNHALAGKLSLPINHPKLTYIGWKSRLEVPIKNEIKYDYLWVVSGPDPYAQQLLEFLLDQILFKDKKIAILYPNSVVLPELKLNMIAFSANGFKNSDELFYESSVIVSRAGYSTLMDLKKIKKRGILIPTKGQGEQIYLAEFLQNDSQFEFWKI